MNLSTFINRPVLSTVISIVLVILGIVGLSSLPIEQYPDVAPPTVMVRATYQGANAETVLNSVIAPLEENINGVEGMTYMTSSASNDGSASITIYFEQGYDGDMAQVNVQNRVTQVEALLPSEVTQAGVTVMKRQTSNVLVLAVSGDKDKYDQTFVGNYAAINLVPAIKRINGVGEAQTFSSDYAMRIWLDPIKMKSYGLIPSDITGILAEQNIEAAPGKVGEQTDNQYEYTLRYKGRLDREKEFKDMVIKSTADGQTIRVSDVATIETGTQTYAYQNESNGNPGTIVMIAQTQGSNARQIVKDVKALVEEQSKTFPPGIKVDYVSDVTEFLDASIEELVKTLLEAFVLVFIVVFIFLQSFRSTLIPLIAVPVSLIGTFLFLWVFGMSLNLLTLSALVLAIAIVVDDAIVVVEAVEAKLDLGYKSAKKASIDAMNEIGGAIVSITLVMSAVFIPVSFMGGTSGTFYRNFGITMAVSIVISAINALTLSPALSALFLKPHNEDGSERKMSWGERFSTAFNAAFESMQSKYQKLIRRIVERPLIAVGAVLVGAVCLVYLAQTTKTGLIPSEDTGSILASVSTPPGTSMAKTKQVMDEVDSMMVKNPAIQNRSRILGYSLLGGAGSNMGTFFIKLKPFEERNEEESMLKYVGVHNLGSEMVLGMFYKQTSAIKGAQILAFQPPMVTGFSMTDGLTFTMQDRTGGDINEFYATTQKFLEELNKRPEISNATTTYDTQYPQYQIDIDVAKTKQAGITPSTVLTTMQGYVGGLYASNYNAYGKLYRVYIQADPQSRGVIEDLKNIYVRTSSGEMSPVTEFATIEKVYGPQAINRFNLYTSIDVTASAASGYSNGDAMQALKEVSEQMLPTGYSYEYSGLTRSESESADTTTAILGLCILFVYLILSAQYESYLVPFSVILSVPFGLAGAFAFTQLFGKNNDIYMQIALIMLIGLLAKNAILIVEMALARRRMGMALSWAAVLGATSRLRPILMTSLAMIIGLMPLLVPMGAGYNGNMTIGAAAIGGMLIGMICQLIFVPALFFVFQYLQEKMSPLKFDDEKAHVDTEIMQYARPISELEKKYKDNESK